MDNSHINIWKLNEPLQATNYPTNNRNVLLLERRNVDFRSTITNNNTSNLLLFVKKEQKYLGNRKISSDATIRIKV